MKRPLPAFEHELALMLILAPLAVTGGRLVRLLSGLEAIGEAFEVEPTKLTPEDMEEVNETLGGTVECAIEALTDAGASFFDHLGVLGEDQPKLLAMEWASYCIRTSLTFSVDIPDNDPFKIPPPPPKRNKAEYTAAARMALISAIATAARKVDRVPG